MKASRRSRHLVARFSDEQATQLQQLARDAGVPVAVLIRISVDALLAGRISLPAPIALAFGSCNRG